ncbi:6-phosphogluconolactonase [Nocardioides guangzhouensis]|uniref:6-phosphogluconolactonase n=1 Tax=Nocardioides guangzhouensis TaxID=2497878 RepID=A0A4Q4ZH88_9ACTN|nr:6-phosphogluconolactonase [Nocardioides guangzhouensis]RYP87543.1 6-phosphogluconolactonase [Nocardioides guangzhouensis]
MSDPTIQRHDTAEELAESVAAALLQRLERAQAAGEVPQIGLTGGTIADHVHQAIARLSPGSSVDWSRVVVWWGDERFVAPDSPDRNASQARAAFLDDVGVDPANVHEMPSTADSASVDDGAEAYSHTMREHGAGAFEVLMLGVGPDGHIASLFPGDAALDVDDRIAVGITDSPKPPPERVTLTFAALNHAKAVWFLVSGDGKAEAVAQALGGADVHEIPATGVVGEDETVWFLDEAAASRL